jgi:uncharacterized protein (DUF362 family)
VKNGDRVLLKVNLLSPSEPSKAVTTHPAVVASVADAVIRAGGKPYIGDSPSGLFTQRTLEKAYATSGLKKVARDMGIELNYDTGARRIPVPNGIRLKKALICNYVLRADKTLALPKIKTHDFMVMTLATKIMFGAVPGLTKAKYHSMFPKKGSFADMLLDVLSVTAPDLFVMDGVVGMEGDGPENGKPVKLGVMLASTNALAMDIAVCKMLGIEPVTIPPLKRAKIRGMWPSAEEYPLLQPSDVEFKGFELPSTARRKIKLSPLPTEECTGCARCEEICPRGAVKVIGGKAKVNYPLCIRCYCCHEVCPANAIRLVSKKELEKKQHSIPDH